MKAHYKLFLSLAIGSFVTFAGCQDDEVVDLVKYPVNQPAITIDDAEGASKATLTAVYKSDGTLELDGPVTRTYTFHFAASPEDATVTFDIINTNSRPQRVAANRLYQSLGFELRETNVYKMGLADEAAALKS